MLPALADDVISIHASDLHLHHTPPPCRAGEPDWYDTQEGYLLQLNRIVEEAGNPPIFYSGDIFNHWRESPEAISMAIRCLPHGFAVPGQHDLQYHNYDTIGKTAYGTLCAAGVITNLTPRHAHVIHGKETIIAWGFPWGHEVEPLTQGRKKLYREARHIAIIHAYIWHRNTNTGYAGAPATALAEAWAKRLEGYDAAAFGDNHKGFLFHNIVNCGGFMRRFADEQDYLPRVALLHRDGSITRRNLDVSRDAFTKVTDSAELIRRTVGFDRLLNELAGACDGATDYGAAVRLWCEQNDPPVELRNLLLAALDTPIKANAS